MKIIDRVIRNSKPFKELEDSILCKVHQASDRERRNLSNEYVLKVEKLIELTERLHNTILSTKHNQDSH